MLIIIIFRCNLAAHEFRTYASRHPMKKIQLSTVGVYMVRIKLGWRIFLTQPKSSSWLDG